MSLNTKTEWSFLLQIQIYIGSNTSFFDRDECPEIILVRWVLMSRMPTKLLRGEIPMQVLCPSASFFPVLLEVFECACFVHIPNQQWEKYKPKGNEVYLCRLSKLSEGIQVFSSLKKWKSICYYGWSHGTYHEDVPNYSTKSKEIQQADSKWSPCLLFNWYPLHRIKVLQVKTKIKFPRVLRRTSIRSASVRVLPKNRED